LAQTKAKKTKVKKPPGPKQAAVRKYLPLMLGIRIPGFFKIHFRYAKRSFITWFVLFIAPFVISVMSLRIICEKFLDFKPSDVQLFVVSFFLIALAFFFAERHRRFRRIYVLAIPALVLVYGVISFVSDPGNFPGNVIKFGILSGLPAWWLWKHAADKGYKALSDGACKDYRPGRDLYMDGHYDEAFARLEPSAMRGQMKSLYLLGHALEHGNGRARDRIKAARFYDKASRKGYGKAHLAFDELFWTFSPEEIEAFETDLGTSGINELF
jgi:hypothetical protein